MLQEQHPGAFPRLLGVVGDLRAVGGLREAHSATVVVTRLDFRCTGVGPTHNTEEKPIFAMSGSHPNAPCPPIAPRLSPYSTSLGRRSGGSCSHRSWIALIIIRPDSIDFCRSPRNEIQLGR